MPDTMQDFDAFRARMNEVILGAGNLTVNRFFALDRRAYEPGAIGTKTKEMLGLVSSLVLRCDDCVTYHVVRCHEEGMTREEFLEVFRGTGGRGQHRDPPPAEGDGQTGRAQRRRRLRITAPIAVPLRSGSAARPR
jgi:AhpD family alkylhydroperoxidase